MLSGGPMTLCEELMCTLDPLSERIYSELFRFQPYIKQGNFTIHWTALVNLSFLAMAEQVCEISFSTENTELREKTQNLVNPVRKASVVSKKQFIRLATPTFLLNFFYCHATGP
jgi:hypothetical protein